MSLVHACRHCACLGLRSALSAVRAHTRWLPVHRGRRFFADVATAAADPKHVSTEAARGDGAAAELENYNSVEEIDGAEEGKRPELVATEATGFRGMDAAAGPDVPEEDSTGDKVEMKYRREPPYVVQWKAFRRSVDTVVQVRLMTD